MLEHCHIYEYLSQWSPSTVENFHQGGVLHVECAAPAEGFINVSTLNSTALKLDQLIYMRS